MTEIRPADINRFTCGDCHIFARALNKLTGWPLHGFINDDGEPDVHAFVVRPDGKAVDIEGVHDLQTFVKRWISNDETLKLHQFQWSDFRCWCGAEFGKHSYRRAKQLAPLIARLP